MTVVVSFIFTWVWILLVVAGFVWMIKYVLHCLSVWPDMVSGAWLLRAILAVLYQADRRLWLPGSDIDTWYVAKMDNEQVHFYTRVTY